MNADNKVNSGSADSNLADNSNQERSPASFSQKTSSKTTSSQTYRRLLGYVKQYKLAFFFAVIGNLIYAAMDVWFISLIEPLMDEGLINGNIELMKLAPLFILGILLVRGLASIVSTYCMAWVGQNVVQKLRQQLVESYLRVNCDFFDSNASGNLVSKVTFNTQQVATASSDALTKLMREGGSIVYAVIFLFYTNWQLASLFFVAAPIIGIIVALTSKRFKNVSHNIQNAMGGVTQSSQEIVEGYKVVKTFGGEDFENERFRKIANRNRQQNMKLILTKAISVPLIQLIAAMAMAIVIYYSAFELAKEQLSPGEFVAMVMMMMFILKPLKVISNLNSILQQGIAAAEDIFTVLDSKRESDAGEQALATQIDSITFERVNFAYGDDQPVISDVSLSIGKGQTVALVGRSGSGKSTLTNLLLRFYDPDSGLIQINNVDIRDFHLDSLRKNIGYVSQQVVLFDNSVSANIAYGENEPDMARVKLAAKKAHAHEFIERLDKGYSSVIGENGAKLSGGQRQRLAIARAIYKDAPIIILDEATSALDTESERHIQAALDALTEDRTTLVIAHRLSTIEKADNIVVMDQGKVIEQGDHRALLAREGLYAKLHAMQFSDDRGLNNDGRSANA